MQLPKKVIIREVGPREGFQTLSRIVPTAEKLELINSLLLTGVSSIEVASYVRTDRVPQMADAEDLVKRLPEPPKGVEWAALYLNRKGFDRYVAASNLSKQGWLYTATSETFLQKNNNCSFEATLAGVSDWISTFKREGVPFKGLVISTAFGCSYEGKAVSFKLQNIVGAFVHALAALEITKFELSLADTVGMAIPPDITRAVDIVRSVTADCDISLHLHDTRGCGIACAYAGLQAGVSLFEGSVGGMGGCPFTKGAAGNIATEDLVYLCDELGVETGISLDRYCESAKVAERIVGTTLPGRVYRVSS